LRYLDAGAVAALGPGAAVQAIGDALRTGFDPAGDPARSAAGLATGEFLLMPSETRSAAGVKVVSVAPGDPARGLPRIQAAYLLFDRESLALKAVLDGTALTTLRTPAVPVATVLPALPRGPLRVVLVGADRKRVGMPQPSAQCDRSPR
jgi:ornithine cyclodeaminase/alanine dehydrogenase-like protein (mu-crystallin family)